ncbi:MULTISPECIES: sensor domain-containing phosphodiesterase [unclassified Caballeronia]|uniref:sensor domain-containing phosphodiesterase n=1 Tax=unclassified Caballeronia TaxID=2646786 RepID=UPI0028665C81|nr:MULTISPECIES: sensor domain-containing phosphodiesterase [unclassified Caballeronia]MDR5776794.1 sensor domain-containing phosphodiesterase [Caballeronia sp. LZ002]MDR5798652.1 sensor domain-containing phosphodiesterase [Caballeronia sp. LZ001]MDR5852234.1 sensor domain-containing phosphodiesterase [Caballeronia sp. LZ003]
MFIPPYPADEAERLSALRSTYLLDTRPESFFDDITRLAAEMFDVPISLVTLVDKERQWFKSRVGLKLAESAREISFCGHAILSKEPTVVLDANLDERFHDNPLVTGEPSIRFYAGAPVVTDDGYAIGTLCIIDSESRPVFGDSEQSRLSALAGLIAQRVDALRSNAYRDNVTGLPNLARFTDDTALSCASAHAVLLDVCTLDYINRMVVAVGLETVNAVAVATTSRLMRALGTGVTLYRIGYARYLFVTEASCGEISEMVRKCVRAFESPLIVGRDLPIDVTPSVGIARICDTSGPSDLIAALIFASERARESHANAVVYDREMGLGRHRTFLLLNSFKDALARNQLRLVYQPRVRLIDGVCVGAEALVRWRHPQLGEISPGEFVPLIANTALINALTDWVLATALRQLAEWHIQHPGLVISVNAVGSDLSRADFVEQVNVALQSAGVSPQRLELEVTEGSLMLHTERSASNVSALRRLGVSLAIDDFGSGFSNLTQLSSLDVAAVKIDQALVRAIMTSPRDATIVRSVIRLVHELGYKAVAEGAETAEILGQVRDWGCDEIQGYFIGRPMEEDVFAAWLAGSVCQL